MAHTFLVEIGLEDMPANVVTDSIKQFATKAKKYLKEQNITFDEVKIFSTPRRLALQISGLIDKQPDVNVEVKGPTKKLAKNNAGNWSKASIGFTKRQGVTTDDILFKKIKGTEYVYINKHIKGKPVESILIGFKNIIENLKFKTMMRWGKYHFEYVRPIKWLVALLDDTVVPFSILDIHTNRVTRGHLFLGQTVTLSNARDYESSLKNQFVIADATKRKAEISKQIKTLARQNDWNINIDANLLEEVNNLVEWPTVFTGKFDEKYLTIPEEVLITSMRDHQRFFYVLDKHGSLLPYFVSVRNGNYQFIETVVAGNEKVLDARLSDAMFFYVEDQQHELDYYVDKLTTVSFHDKISTMYEKMKRVQTICHTLGPQFGLSADDQAYLDRTSQLYKFDLVTGMVGEFSELQGVMGEKYALLKGESKTTATAIREHYMPISADGVLPETKVGAVLSIADKIDSLLTFFSSGMVPNGSNDPYALRRQANGVVRIIRKEKWPFNEHIVRSLLVSENAYDNSLGLNQLDQVPALFDFLKDRVKVILQKEGVRHDIIDAVVRGPNTDLLDIFDAAGILSQHQADEEFKSTIEAFNRVLRLVDKRRNYKSAMVNSNLFNNDSEAVLKNKVQSIEEQVIDIDIIEYFSKLSQLKDPINKYFAETMIMVDDVNVKNNRLNQLKLIADLIYRLGDLKQLIVK